MFICEVFKVPTFEIPIVRDFNWFCRDFNRDFNRLQGSLFFSHLEMMKALRRKGGDQKRLFPLDNKLTDGIFASGVTPLPFDLKLCQRIKL